MLWESLSHSSFSQQTLSYRYRSSIETPFKLHFDCGPLLDVNRALSKLLLFILQCKMISFGIFKHFVYHYFLIVSVNGSYNHSRPFEKVDFDICPFTNFCHQNATAALNMKGKVPCCTPCSCSDNCWGLGNCCPDKELIGHSVPQLKCALAMVKEPGIKNLQWIQLWDSTLQNCHQLSK